MKTLAVVLLVLLVASVSAQTQTVPTGLKLIAVSGQNISFITQDSTLMGQRYMTRTGPWYNQRYVDSLRALIGFNQHYVDSLKAASFRAGQNTPAVQVKMTTPDSVFNYERR